MVFCPVLVFKTSMLERPELRFRPIKSLEIIQEPTLLLWCIDKIDRGIFNKDDMKNKFLLPLTFSFLFSLSAFADLQVFPLRIVLGESQKTAQISLRHKGKQNTRYRISTVFYQMSENGEMKALEKVPANEPSAADFLRYSPKIIQLEPNVEQVIRVVLRQPPNLPVGEYRTHLHFEETDPPTTLSGDAPSDAAQMFLKARMAVAIPVIVRVGNPALKVTASNLKIIQLPNQKKSFSFEVQKEGPGFIYGDLDLISVSEKGEEKIFKSIAGVSSYINKRTITFPLEENLTKGKFKVVLRRSAEDGNDFLASTETAIP